MKATRQERERLSRLEARVVFLDRRIEEKTARNGKVPDGDVGERSALRWAIDLVCDAMHIDVNEPSYAAEVAKAKARSLSKRGQRW